MIDETATTPTASSRFVWHDLMTTDPEAAQAFYSALFGWDIKDVPMPHGIYRMIQVGEQGLGGIEAVAAEGVPAHWLGYVSVPDVDAAVKTAVDHGGQVHLEPTDIPEVGRFAILGDPAGAVLAPFRSVHGDLPEADAKPGPGTFCFDELLSTDTDTCIGFYTELFGWNHESMTMPTGPDMPEMTYHLFREGAGETVKDRAGMLQMPPGVPAPSHWLPYIAVDDVDACCDEAASLGGTIHKAPDDIPNLGRFAVLADPQGAAFAVWKQMQPPDA